MDKRDQLELICISLCVIERELEVNCSISVVILQDSGQTSCFISLSGLM